MHANWSDLIIFYGIHMSYPRRTHSTVVIWKKVWKKLIRNEVCWCIGRFVKGTCGIQFNGFLSHWLFVKDLLWGYCDLGHDSWRQHVHVSTCVLLDQRGNWFIYQILGKSIVSYFWLRNKWLSQKYFITFVILFLTIFQKEDNFIK